VLAHGAGAQAQIALELRFDGQPFDPEAPPEFTCLSASLGRWVGCRVDKADGPGAYALIRPAPGKYRLHVSIDENRTNPRRFPGDYEGGVDIVVTETEPERVAIDLPRLIHLTRPGDNGRPLEGMLTGCATEPRFETPRFAWGPAATVEFGWEPIVAGAEYRVNVVARSCGQARGQREVWSEKTAATTVAVALPPSADDEHYVFRVEAWKDGRLIGDLYTHDSGTHSWNYRFRVLDASVPRWLYFAGAAGLALLVLGARAMLGGVDRATRRLRARVAMLAVVAVVAVVAIAAGGYSYYQSRVRRNAEEAQAAAEGARRARQRDVVDAFVAAAPRPAWWDAVETPYRVDNVGDLLAAWQGFPRGDTGTGERQFFKATYQGILDHADDEHVVATGIDLLHHVVRDYPHRLEMARFGYERYFTHRRRVDNCANCMAGDTTQGLAQNLSQLYLEAGRSDDAIEACRRLVEERAADVSPYKLAETWDRIAWAHWQKGERQRAVEITREALARYGSTVRADDLKRTLARFEAEQPR
jgi:tetratricopeptide (TPR) repeat protein